MKGFQKKRKRKKKLITLFINLFKMQQKPETPIFVAWSIDNTTVCGNEILRQKFKQK
jgi:hypothetical protein